MPVVYRYRGFRFQSYANEGNPREPVHIRVIALGRDAKFWLRPGVRLAYNIGYDPRTLDELTRFIELRRAELEAAWHDFFGN